MAIAEMLVSVDHVTASVIQAPKGCLANPEFPAPTIARFCADNQLAGTLMKALGQAVPRQISART